MVYTSHVDDAAVAAYLNNPYGDLASDLRKRARRVEAGAKAMVGVKTGRLRNSISVSYAPGRKGTPEFSIGSNVGYALMHHEGTRPHIIRPNVREKLRFKVRGVVVYATQVHHPGTRPNHFLTIPLERYGVG